MVNLDNNNNSIIIKPNLGQPILLNLRDFQRFNGKFIDKITFNILVIDLPHHSTAEVIQYYNKSLWIQPILKEEGKFLDRRGKKYPLEIQNIEIIQKEVVKNRNLLSDFECEIWDILNSSLQNKKVYGKKTQLFKINVLIKDIEEIYNLIVNSRTEFILFDLLYKHLDEEEYLINYHSLAIYNKDWKDFHFIHASDLHIAGRNDYIIKNFNENQAEIEKSLIKNEKNPQDQLIKSREFEYRENFQEEKFKELKSVKYNPNYNLRLFIAHVNKKFRENSLDFILFTGDLVDYVSISPEYRLKKKNNFIILFEILLGINSDWENDLGRDKEFNNNKEILVPIFTIVGNHDYRKGHYSLCFAKSYKSFGFNKNEVKSYNNKSRFNYINAIYSKTKYLQQYFRLFNANLNFRIEIGDYYSFIFLNTGKDSLANWPNLLKGSPTTKGIKDYQITLLRNFMRLSQNKKIIVAMHTPPISPHLSYLKKRKYRKKLKNTRKNLNWSDFYEENLKNHDIKKDLNKILNLKYKTFMNNWSTILKILIGSEKQSSTKADLILCGHTHTLREYRLKQSKETKIINIGYWIFPTISKVPCVVYTSKYSDKFSFFKNPQELYIWFEANKPLIFHTQSLGLLSRNNGIKAPGFRYYKVKNNQIIDNNTYFLHLEEPKIKPVKLECSEKPEEKIIFAFEEKSLQMGRKLKIGIKN